MNEVRNPMIQLPRLIKKRALGRMTPCKVKNSIEIFILCYVSHIVRDVTYLADEHCIWKYVEEGPEDGDGRVLRNIDT